MKHSEVVGLLGRWCTVCLLDIWKWWYMTLSLAVWEFEQVGQQKRLVRECWCDGAVLQRN